METNDPNLIRPIREISSKNKPADFWNELSPEKKAEVEAADKVDTPIRNNLL